eukprot:COSAG01_NODE_47523_length_389_cov_1.231034_1_plen_27_part_10
MAVLRLRLPLCRAPARQPAALLASGLA